MPVFLQLSIWAVAALVLIGYSCGMLCYGRLLACIVTACVAVGAVWGFIHTLAGVLA